MIIFAETKPLFTLTRFLFIAIFTIWIVSIQAQCVRSGAFVANDPARYPLSGDGSLVFNEGGNMKAKFDENFATVQGLALEVFLSKTGILDTDTDVKISTTPLGEGITTGGPITGEHIFDIPADIAIEDFDHLLIQCTSINELWGNIALTQPEGNCDTSTSIVESEVDAVSVYPVPAYRNLNIRGYKKGMTIEVYSTVGKKVVDNIHQDQLDVSNLPNGTYLLSMQYNGKKRVIRFLKR